MEPEQYLVIILLSGSILFVFLSMIRRYKERYRRKTEVDDHSAVNYSSNETQRLRETIEKLQLELNVFNNEKQAQLNTRIRMLNRLIEESDEKIRRFEELLDAAGKPVPPRKKEHKPRQEELIPSADDAPPASAGQPDSLLNARVVKLAEEGRSKLDIAKETGLKIGEIELILNIQGIKKD